MMEWDSKDFRQERDRKLASWFRGDINALKCFVAISNIAEVWDDVIDGDTPPQHDVNRAIVDMMIGLNDNLFFIQHRNRIMAGLVMTLNAWLDANEMAKSENKEQRIKAYMLRNLGLELVPLFVYILRGYGQMRELSMEIREFFAHETFESWEKEHGQV